MNKRLFSTRYISHGAVIAALYAALTFAASTLGIAFGPIQFRFSEALAVLAWFTPAAVPGLFIGCIIANILCGCVFWDIVFGSLATLAGAVLLRWLRLLYGKGVLDIKAARWLAPIPNLLLNTAVIPFVLAFVYRFPGSLTYFFLTVGVGEVISGYALGILLFIALEKKPSLFK